MKNKNKKTKLGDLTEKEKKVLESLKEVKSSSKFRLVKNFGLSNQELKRLEEAGMIKVERKEHSTTVKII